MTTSPSELDRDRLAVLSRALTRAERVFLNDAGRRHRLMRALRAGHRGRAASLLAAHVDDVGAVLDEVPSSWWFDRESLRVVATGFGPFLENDYNPSWDAARGFAEAVNERFSARATRVDVTYEAARRATRDIGLGDGQLVAVHLGLASAGGPLRVERYAHNTRAETPDESGQHAWPDWVVPTGPAALETLAGAQALANEIDAVVRPELQLGARSSRDAGRYVCNAIYYASLQAVHAARLADRAAEAVFVHIPPVEPARASRLGALAGQAFCAHLERHFSFCLDDGIH